MPGQAHPHFSSSQLCHRYPPTHLSTGDPTETPLPHTPTCPQAQPGPEFTACLQGRSAQASVANSAGGAAERHYVCRTLDPWRAVAGGQGHTPGERWGSQQDHCSRLRLSPAASPRAPAPSKRQWETQGPFKQLPSSRSFPHRLPAGALHPSSLPPQQRQPCLALCLAQSTREAAGAGGHWGWRKSWMMWRFCANPSGPRKVPFLHPETLWPTGGLETHRAKSTSLGSFQAAVPPPAERTFPACSSSPPSKTR